MPFWDKLFKQPDSGDLYISGNSAWVQGQFDKAISDFTAAIQLESMTASRRVFPTLAQMYEGRGQAYEGKGEIEKSVADCTEAIRLDPKLFFAYGCRARCYRKKGLLTQAISDMSEAIRRHSGTGAGSAGSYTERANLYFEIEDYSNALVDYTEAIRCWEPKSGEAFTYNCPLAQAFNNRGMAYLNTGLVEKAVADFNQAVRFEPVQYLSCVAYVYNRGCAYLAAKSYENALADFSYVIQRVPDCIAAYQGRAAVYRATSKDEAASSDEAKAQELIQGRTSSQPAASTSGANWGEAARGLVGIGAAGVGVIFLAAVVKFIIIGGIALAAGAAVASVTSKCRHCGSPLNEGYNVCPQCGRTSQW